MREKAIRSMINNHYLTKHFCSTCTKPGFKFPNSFPNLIAKQ